MLVIEITNPEVLVQMRCCVAETKAEETKKAKPAPGVDLDAKPKKKAKKGGCC